MSLAGTRSAAGGPRRRRILVALLAGPLFLGGAELALSLVRWPPPFSGLGLPITVPYDVLGGAWGNLEFDPQVVFRFRRGIRSVGVFPINSLGLVGPEARADRAPGSVRVVCLGDSCTFGGGEIPGRSYPDLLRGMLGRAFGEGRVEVLNAGVPTYTTIQSLRRLRRDLAPLRPDVVVAYHGGHNEFQETPMTVAEVTARLSRPGARLFRTSRVARGLRCLLAGVLPRARADARGGTVRVPLPDFRRDLEALAEECRGRGIGLVLVVPPHSDEKRATQPLSTAYEEEVRRAAGELGVPAADAAARFDALAPYPLWTEAVHPNVVGYRLVALSVYEALVGSPSMEEIFLRAGPSLSALRAFEGLAARMEREEPGEEEWRRVERALREAEDSTPELERARGIVEVRLGGAPLGEGSLRRTGFLGDGVALAFARLLAGDGARALDLARAGRAAHPYRPGVAALAEALGASAARTEGESGSPPGAPGVPAEVLRMEVAPADPLDRALRAGPTLEDVRRSPARASAAALILLHRDRVVGAPPAVDPRVGRAAQAVVRQDAPLARALLEAALEANPDEVNALAQLALLETAEGREERARVLLERVVRSDPAYGAAWIALAALAVRRGQPEVALSCLDACLETRPYLSGALVLRARVRRDRGDVEGARRDLVRVREIGAWGPELEVLWKECGGG